MARVTKEPFVGWTKKTLAFALVALLAGCATAGTSSSVDSDRPFDLIISNARIVDGTGNPWFRGDIGIRGDRIAARARARPSPRTAARRSP